jgi:hypothetical protein
LLAALLGKMEDDIQRWQRMTKIAENYTKFTPMVGGV